MNRQITALTCNRAKRASRLLVAMLALATGDSFSIVASTAQAQEGMRPVPRFSGTSIRDQRTNFQKSAGASSLQWRVSGEVAPVVASKPAAVAPASSTSPGPAVQVQTGAYQPPIAQRDVIAPVRQARYQNTAGVPGDEGGLQLPPGLQPKVDSTVPTPTPPKDAAKGSAKPLPDFFSDPFGDETADTAPAEDSTAPSAPADAAKPSPTEVPGLSMPPAVKDPATPPNPSDLPKATVPKSNQLRLPSETMDTDEPATKAPNPFDKTRSEDEKAADADDRKQLEDFDFPARPGDLNSPSPLRTRDNDDDLKRPSEFSCDEFRKSIAEATIQKVSLDISPPFRPDVIELDEYKKLKSKFENAQEIRDWQSIDGRKLGRGRLTDLAYEKIVIETEFGTVEELPINRISEADLAYLSKNWGLPQECLIEQATYEPRDWQHSKVTWKASNLCHKPLYFEEVNLERYGHDAGPFAQPIISSAHFFANIAVLPYKMGVHGPSECQYALGYYRPGNCAPWIVPPVPLSLRGGLYQAAAMTGTFWLIP